MGDLTQRIRHDEEYYVTKMNLRHEKDLKKQIRRLNREKEIRGKTMDVDQKPYEEKLRKLGARVEEIEQLSKDNDSASVSGIQSCEDSLLRDLTRKPLVTGAGYSYAKCLVKNAETLVKRPLQWGINPSLSTLKHSMTPVSATAQTSQTSGVLNSISLIPHVKGKSLSLKQKYADFAIEKQRKPQYLPPLRTKNIFDKKKQTLSSVRGYHWKPKGSVDVKKNCVTANEPSEYILIREKPIDIRESKGSKEEVVSAETAQIAKEMIQHGVEVRRVDIADEDGKDHKESQTRTAELEDKSAQKLGVFATEFSTPSYELTELRRNSYALDLVMKRKRDANMNASFSKYRLLHQRPRRYSL